MTLSESANRLRAIIEIAIDKHYIKRSDYDHIISIALEDGFIDPQEKALLAQLQDLIEDKTIKIMAE